ncbi:MAG: response regulator transcription factor [Candidatus Gracilibacteria bacterium]|nr:response regulator transcription factor [Candidatus Gracilibacteria bacterium]
MNILIIEDDEFLSNKIKGLFLKKDGVNLVKIISNFEDFVNCYHNVNNFDIILVDIYLSNNSKRDTGIEIIKLIRNKNKLVPIIVISGLNDIGWLRLGFDNGANDYICKPFRLAELEIRVLKLMKDYFKIENLGKDDKLEYNGLIYFFGTNKFTFDGNVIELTKLSKSILLLLLSRKESLISEICIIEKVWGDNYGYVDRNIRVAISRLKKGLSKYGLDSWIHNIRGEGYILKK